jgi:hypothetical protein
MSRAATMGTCITVAMGVMLLCSCDDTAACTKSPCFRNIDCVKTCGGPVLSSGCCACAAGTFDSIQCRKETGAADARECEKNPCARAYECVATCSGALVYTGCCPCPMGSVDRVTQCREASVGDRSGH